MEKFQPNQYEGEAPSKRPDIVSGYRDLPSKLETKEAHEAVEKVRAILELIDEQTIFELFQEYFGKVGNEVGSLDGTLSYKSDISVYYNSEDGVFGSYHPSYGIRLNAHKLCNRKDQVLNTLIHEYLHEVSALRSQWQETSLQNGAPGMMHISPSGFSKIVNVYGYEKETDSISDKKDVLFFDNKINEGITQILADDIHAEYLKREGESGAFDKRKFREQDIFTFESYLDEQFNVRVYIALVSALTHIPEDDVKNAVTRSYFRNGSIVPEEFADLLHNVTFSADEVVKELKHQLETKGFTNGIMNNLLPWTELSIEDKIKLCDRFKELHDSYLACKQKIK